MSSFVLIHHFEWSYLVTATFGSLCLGDNCSSLGGTHTAEITLRHFLCRDGSTRGKAINRAIKPLTNHISLFFFPHLRLVPLSSASKNKQEKALFSRGIVSSGGLELKLGSNPHSWPLLIISLCLLDIAWLLQTEPVAFSFTECQEKTMVTQTSSLHSAPSPHQACSPGNKSIFPKVLDQVSWLCGFMRKFCRKDIGTISHAQGLINCIHRCWHSPTLKVTLEGM